MKNNHYLIETFIQHRKEIKSPFTAQALTMFKNKVSKLEKEGYEIKELINLAIESGWKTIYPHTKTQKSYPQKARTTLGEQMDISNMRTPSEIKLMRDRTAKSRLNGFSAIRDILG